MAKENKAYRTEQFIIKKGHPLNKYLMDMMYLSNNLYNATNFHLRQLWTGLKLEDENQLHSLQKEIIDLFSKTIPVVNKNNKDKYKKLIEKDKIGDKIWNI